MRSHQLAMLSFAAVAVLSACAQPGGNVVPTTSLASRRTALPDLTPPTCKGQKSAKRYSSLTVTLSTKGGSLCIPEYGGFGGTIKYPGADPSVKLTINSSTKDYTHLPQLGKGTAIFYLLLAISGGTSFADKVSTGGGLTAQEIVPGKPYTAYAEAQVSGITFHFKPCYVVATKGKYGGVIGGIGTLLEGADVPEAAHGAIMIYAGRQASAQC